MNKRALLPIILIVFSSVKLFCIENKADEPQAVGSTQAYNHYLSGVLFEKENKYEEAAKEYETTLQLDPNAYYVYKNLASLHLKTGKIDEAEKLALTMLELDSNDADGFSFLGTIYFMKGDMQKANDTFLKMYELDKNRNEALVYLANINYKTNPRKALEYLLEYVKDDSDAVEIYYQIALIYADLNDSPKVVEYLEKTINLDPAHFQAHLALAREFEKQKKMDMAVAHYQKCLALDPSNKLIAEYLATLLLEKSDYKEAEKIFKKINEDAKSDVLSNFWLGILAEEKNDFKRAIQYIKSMSGYEKDVSMLLRLSYYYAKMGKPEQSVKILKRAHKLSPENAEVCFFLGLGYETVGKLKPALKYLNKAAAFKNDFAEAYFQKAIVEDKLGMFRGSIASLLKVISINPKHSSSYNYLGYSYADRNINLGQSLDLIETALKIEPENGAYIDSLGWVYYRRGEYDKAVEQLKLAAEKLKDPTIIDHLGDALWMKYRAGKSTTTVDEVISIWEEASKMGVDTKLTDKKIQRAKKYGFGFPVSFSELNKISLQYKDILKDLSCLVTIGGSSRKNGLGRINGLFYYKKDSGLKIDILGPMMLPAGSILYNNENIKIYPTNLERLIKLSSDEAVESIKESAELITSLLSAGFADRFLDPSVTDKSSGSRACFTNQYSSICINTKKRAVTRYKYISGSGLEVHALIKSFEVVDGVTLPSKIIIEIPELDAKYTFKLGKISINKNISGDIFKMQQ